MCPPKLLQEQVDIYEDNFALDQELGEIQVVMQTKCGGQANFEEAKAAGKIWEEDSPPNVLGCVHACPVVCALVLCFFMHGQSYSYMLSRLCVWSCMALGINAQDDGLWYRGQRSRGRKRGSRDTFKHKAGMAKLTDEQSKELRESLKALKWACPLTRDDKKPHNFGELLQSTIASLSRSATTLDTCMAAGDKVLELLEGGKNKEGKPLISGYKDTLKQLKDKSMEMCTVKHKVDQVVALDDMCAVVL